MNNSKIFIIPSVIWISLFIIVPLIFVFVISFSEPIYNIPPYKLPFKNEDGILTVNLFLDNFRLLFSDNIYFKSFLSSISTAIISTLIAILIALPIAFQISQAAKSMRAILLIAVIVPFWTSILLRIYAWIIILKPNGLINNLLMYFSLIDVPLNLLNSKMAVIIGITYTYLPFMIFPIYNAIEKIDKSLYEAAKDLGASTSQIFFKILLPLSFNGILVGSTFVFIPALGDFLVPNLLGGSEIISMGGVIWNEFFINADWPMASAITVVLALIILIPVIFLKNTIERQ